MGDLRLGLDVDRATDLVVVLAGHDVYRGLVQEARWPVMVYKAWLFNALNPAAAGHAHPRPAATAELSFAGVVPPTTAEAT